MNGFVSHIKFSSWQLINIFHSVQNEEVLKKCAQEYLSRVRKEEQRYQALKIHAEEKLDKWVYIYTLIITCLFHHDSVIFPKGKTQQFTNYTMPQC